MLKPPILPSRLFLFGVILLSLILTGCGPSPSARQVADLVQHNYEKAGLGEIVKVRTLGIQERWVKSEDHQKLSVYYDMEFLMDYGDAVAEFGEQTDTRGLNLSSLKEGIGLATLRIEFGEFKKGDMVFRKDHLHIRQGESGWAITDS